MKTSTGPAMSRRSNLGCSTTSTSMGSSDTAEVLFALIVTVLGEGVCFEGRKRSYVGVETDNWTGRIKLMSLLR